MLDDLLSTSGLKEYFISKNYNYVKPHNIVNNRETVFLTAGIQPIITDFRDDKLENHKQVYISQPVIRTQFVNEISEGTSIAFTNLTTAGFNISEREHNLLVEDWMLLFYEMGMKLDCISTKNKVYEDIWGDLSLYGNKTFYYYNDIEIGDTTFFTSVTRNGHDIGIDTMSDVGFGLERIKWCLSNSSYFDIYKDSSAIPMNIKAYLSVIALLAVNEVKPSNKNSGYRARLFSKKLAISTEGRKLFDIEIEYLNDCIKYWLDRQEVSQNIDIKIIETEYVRNCNRYIIDQLINDGYDNLSGININITREELEKRLISSNVDRVKVKRLIK